MAQTGQQAGADRPTIEGYSGLRLISRGSTAKVYRARQDRLDRLVAIKVLRIDDELTTAEQVARELATTVALSAQPHIVSIIDTGSTDAGRPYIVMDYCEDGSYGHILRQAGPLPVAEVVDVGVKVGEALHAAHLVGIVHRDVKPHNVLRSRYGPALTDFGIARATGDLSGTITLNKLTPEHASPEALSRQAQGPASDVYSLASTMWNLLVGHPPFADPGDNAPDPFVYRDRALHDPLPPMPRPDVPPWLQQELGRAMSKFAAERHESAAAFADALRRGWASATGQLWTPPSSYRPLPDATDAGRAPTGLTGRGGSTGFGQPDMHGSIPPPGVPSPGGPFPPSPFPAGPSGAPVAPARSPAQAGTPAQPGGPTQPGALPPGSAQAAPMQAGSAWTGSAQAGWPETVRTQAGSAQAGPAQPAPWARPQDGRSAGGVADPDDAEHAAGARRRIGIWPFVAAAVAGVLLGAGVLIALRFSGGPEDPPAAHGDGASSTPGPGRASADPSIRPTDLRLADHHGWVRLTWTDHTDGKALYFVTGAPAGTTQRQLSQPARSSTRRINGLRTDVDYCFAVLGMLTVDHVSAPARVCTSRTP